MAEGPKSEVVAKKRRQFTGNSTATRLLDDMGKSVRHEVRFFDG
jgi:hypothetical protein